MADIRYTTAVLDTFNRPNEDPVLPPWQTDNGQTMKIKGNQFYGKNFPNSMNHAYWSTTSFTGTQMEVWGRVGFAGAATADGWRFGFNYAGPDFIGYQCIPWNAIGPDSWLLRRYNTGSGFTALASTNHGLPGVNHYCLMQIDGAAINCYLSTDNCANWTLILTANDSSLPRTNLYAHLGMTGVDTSWNDFGAGIPRERVHRAEIYRWLPGELRTG